MAPFDMNFSTAVVLLILAVLVVLAVRRMVGRGLCDSGGSCEGCHGGSAGGGCGSGSHGGCGSGSHGGCPSCSAVEKMVADLEGAAKGK